MFNLLGIDWGSKWVGLALGDSTTNLVVPYDWVEFSQSISLIGTVLNKYPITKIVIGRPVNFQLQPTEVTRKVEDFKDSLQIKFSQIGIVLVNERNSSKESILGFKVAPSSKKSSFGYKSKREESPQKSISSNSIHSLAAKTILEYYLEKEAN